MPTLDYYYLGKIEEHSELKIINLFQQLSKDEQEMAMELINTYIRTKYNKFD